MANLIAVLAALAVAGLLSWLLGWQVGAAFLIFFFLLSATAR